MGARNVSAALVLYPDLTHRARLALIVMGLTALDQPTDTRPARTYFGGIEPIADGLGYTRNADGEVTGSATRQVLKVLAELRARGAIESKVKGGNGNRAVYHLKLDPLESG